MSSSDYWKWDLIRGKYYYIDHANQQFVYQNGSIAPFPNTGQNAPPGPPQQTLPSPTDYQQPLLASNTSYQQQANPILRDPSVESVPDLTHSVGSQQSAYTNPLSPTSLHPYIEPPLIDDRYKVVRNLGKGAQTATPAREVFDRVDQARYALKTYDGSQTAFQREVTIMGRLRDSPHVVQFIRNFTIPGHGHPPRSYLVMTPVANRGTLYEILVHQLKNPAREIVTGGFTHTGLHALARGLEDIHRVSVRHKDIKPDNILNHNGHLLYTDFGLSLDYDGLPDKDESKGARPRYDCTRLYAAHETFNNTPRNRKSDVFCLGAIFFEIVAARCVAITGDPIWFEGTRYGKKPDRYYYQAIDNNRIYNALDRIGEDDELYEVHAYLSLIKRMMNPERDFRPESGTILKTPVY